MEQKKIAILTQPLKSNYGGIIQNYALQKVLKNNYFNVITVDRDYPEFSKIKLTLSFYKRKILSFLKNNNNVVLSKKNLKEILSNSTNFIETNINRTSKIRNEKALTDVFDTNHFDAVIVGSDQVWRPMYSPNIYNYYLDFLIDNKNIKKIAYAASFGTEQWEYDKDQTQYCKELVEEFDLVTVREKSALKLVENNFNVKAHFVLDPTLLLSKEDYNDLIYYEKSLINNKGIYTYVLDRNSDKNNLISNIEEILDKKSFFCQPKFSTNQPISKTIEDYKYPKVEQWLKGFNDADFIITDSFHGTVFSIIYNKPFIAIANKERGASRFESLLEELGLLDRLVYSNTEVTEELIKRKIDFDSVNSKIKMLKEQSLQLLLSSIC